MLDTETRGLFASIGIEKGKKFDPDERMQKILADGVAIGNAASRSIVWYPRYEKNMKGVRVYPDTDSAWIMAYTGRNVHFNGEDGQTMNTDARVMFHYPYTAVTPAMAAPREGKGSDYAIAYVDSDKQPFDGAKTYTLNIPADPPVGNFWAVTVYDPQTRSMLQSNQKYPTVGGNTKGLRKNTMAPSPSTSVPRRRRGTRATGSRRFPARAGSSSFACTPRSSPGSIRPGVRVKSNWRNRSARLSPFFLIGSCDNRSSFGRSE
jgi:hypothetical protein